MMTNEQKKIVDILNTARRDCRYQDDCDKCPYVKYGANCLQAMMADRLINAGVVIPTLCGNCSDYDPELGICKIRYDSWGGKLERGQHDFCSDGKN